MHDEVHPVQTVAALARADEYLTERFARLSQPLLIMHGTDDRAAPPGGSQALFDAATSTDKTLRLYEDYKHDLLNHVGRDRVINDIGNWIEQRAHAG